MPLPMQPVFSNTMKTTRGGKVGNIHKDSVVILLGKEKFRSLTGGEIYIEMLNQRYWIEDCGMD